MSQTYKTAAFVELYEALKERAAKHGDEVKVNFVRNCLKRVNPKIMTIMNVANDTEWSFLPKPDDAPDKGASDEGSFIAQTKDRYYKQWLERVNKGEFDKKRPDMHIGEDAPEEEEEVDMVALARAEKEKAQKIAEAEQAPVSIVNEPKEEEEDKDCLETCNGEPCPNGKECEPHEDDEPKQKVVYHGTAGPAADLLHALEAFIASTDSPPEDKPDAPLAALTEVMDVILERLDKLEKKQKSLFNAMRDL